MNTTDAITLAESKRLIELENIVSRGKQTFIEVGTALAEIRDSKLYRCDYRTFEEYIRTKWGWTKQHVYRLIECAPIAKSNPQVTSINQARALAKVEPIQRTEVLERATKSGKKITAKTIKEVAKVLPPGAQRLKEIEIYEARQVALLRRIKPLWKELDPDHRTKFSQWMREQVGRELGI